MRPAPSSGARTLTPVPQAFGSANSKDLLLFSGNTVQEVGSTR